MSTSHTIFILPKIFIVVQDETFIHLTPHFALFRELILTALLEELHPECFSVFLVHLEGKYGTCHKGLCP